MRCAGASRPAPGIEKYDFFQMPGKLVAGRTGSADNVRRTFTALGLGTFTSLARRTDVARVALGKRLLNSLRPCARWVLPIRERFLSHRLLKLLAIVRIEELSRRMEGWICYFWEKSVALDS